MLYGATNDVGMSIELCVQRCISLGYTVAGLEFSTQCMTYSSAKIACITKLKSGFCDNFIHNNASIKPDLDCAMACGGNRSEVCGGPNRLSGLLLTVQHLTALAHGFSVFKRIDHDSACSGTAKNESTRELDLCRYDIFSTNAHY
jgi:hypothetical protein